jgi:hypothetical protein
VSTVEEILSIFLRNTRLSIQWETRTDVSEEELLVGVEPAVGRGRWSVFIPRDLSSISSGDRITKSLLL